MLHQPKHQDIRLFLWTNLAESFDWHTTSTKRNFCQPPTSPYQ
ncbi:hypothetical protein [Okeania sp. SIO1F9]|nr:hypothetical protein [Okeania sp. SIO1F9]